MAKGKGRGHLKTSTRFTTRLLPFYPGVAHRICGDSSRFLLPELSVSDILPVKMASTSKFTFLETTHLASQPPSSEVTMQNLIDTSERMAEEAKEIMPYSFDECTYAKGYLRQAIWSCLGEFSSTIMLC